MKSSHVLYEYSDQEADIMRKVYVFLADGFEEIEGLTVVDILRRAQIDVETVSVMGREEILGSHKIRVKADRLLEEIRPEEAQMLVLPGGLKGTENLEQCRPLLEAVKKAYDDGRKVAAICAAPRILAGLGILDGKKATVYPGMESYLAKADVQKVPAVTDGTVTTGRGMGAAGPFALELTAVLLGQEKAAEIGRQIVYQPGN